MPYNGIITVMAPNHNPVFLPVETESLDSYHHLSFMEKVADLERQRSRLPLISTVLKTGPVKKSDVEVRTGLGSREINSASGEIMIKNTSDRALNNVRIMSSTLSNVFLLDKSNIAKI